MAKKTYKSGETVGKSGIYNVEGPRGGSTEQQVTCVEGEPFPPSPKSGQKYTLSKATKHKK